MGPFIVRKDALTPEQIAELWAYVGSRGGKEN